MFRHEEKLILFPVKTFLKNSANIITAFKTGFTVPKLPKGAFYMYLRAFGGLSSHVNNVVPTCYNYIHIHVHVDL